MYAYTPNNTRAMYTPIHQVIANRSKRVDWETLTILAKSVLIIPASYLFFHLPFWQNTRLLDRRKHASYGLLGMQDEAPLGERQWNLLAPPLFSHMIQKFPILNNSKVNKKQWVVKLIFLVSRTGTHPWDVALKTFPRNI